MRIKLESVAKSSVMAARWVGQTLVLPPIECYWLVNASPLNYGRRSRVGQNSGPIFNHLRTKVHSIKYACAEVSVVCNAVFRLTISCVPKIFASSSREVIRNRAEISCFGAPKFRGERISNQIWVTIEHVGKVWWWRSAKRPRRLGGEKS